MLMDHGYHASNYIHIGFEHKQVSK